MGALLADSLRCAERGKLADRLVLDANPLADIRNISKVHLVIKGGVGNN